MNYPGTPIPKMPDLTTCTYDEFRNWVLTYGEAAVKAKVMSSESFNKLLCAGRPAFAQAQATARRANMPAPPSG